MKKYAAWIVIALLSLAVVILAYFQFFSLEKDNQPSNGFSNKYPFLSKRLAAEEQNDVLINFQPLREEVKAYLSSINVPHSFYFEYLPSGVSLQDGEDNQLVGASLLKVPLVMNLYKAAEQGKIDLDKEQTITQIAPGSDNVYTNQLNLKVGDKITLRKAAEYTMTHSDNTTALLIYNSLKGVLSPQDEVIKNLDIASKSELSNNVEYVYISAKAYSSILKCLYLSCYLDLDNSQEILGYLGKSVQREYLASGIPKDIPIANKMGTAQDQIISDCGIIYVPNRPYLACLMLFTKTNGATQYFNKVSSMIYKYIRDSN